jgi:serine/threonine protein kinase
MVDEHLISLQPGSLIAGRYEVIKCLGSGNMGLVYACRHRELTGHNVAIKVLFPEVAQDKIAAARFRNEIFASYGVSHPNVVRAYEYLKDGDLQAYTMEYVAGGDLADRLGDRDNLVPIPEIVRLLAEMSAGLQAIHDAGIVHRDMKPENILLTKDGHVKIADFGIARTGTGPRLTEHGGVVGTIEYVSPEYMLNSQVDWRSDIYALGIIAYEMITGEAAFQGDSVYATMTKKLKEDPAPPSKKRPECPAKLDAIVLKAMVRDPEHRYQSAAEIFHDLEAIQEVSGKPQAKILTRAPAVSSTYVGPSLLKDDEVANALKKEQEGGAAKRANKSGGYQPAADLLAVPTSSKSPHASSDQWAISQPITGRGGSEDKGPSEQTSSRPRRDTPTEDWIQPKRRSEGIKITQSEPNRTQRLNELQDEGSRSLVIDLITLVFAVLIGVGLGFVVLRSLFPDLLNKQNEQSVQVVE